MMVRTDEVDDQLGWTLRCLRAWEQGSHTKVIRCIRAYPHLGTIVKVYVDPALGGPALERLRDHAVTLARSAVVPADSFHVAPIELGAPLLFSGIAALVLLPTSRARSDCGGQAHFAVGGARKI